MLESPLQSKKMMRRNTRFAAQWALRSARVTGPIACVLLLVLAGCPGGHGTKDETQGGAIGPKVDLFATQPSGASSRTFECTSRGANGVCNVNQCTQGPGGSEPYDCASFASQCVDAGQHWSGTREGGKCTRVL